MIQENIKMKDKDLLPKTEEFENLWREWYNDFANMYPTSYLERHKELKPMYPELYE